MSETEDDKKDASAQDKPEDASGDWRSQLEGHLEDAKVMGKEIGEKLGDASRRASDEAKEAWKTLEPQIGSAEASLREAADGAVESLQGMFSDLKGQLGKLREKL